FNCKPFFTLLGVASQSSVSKTILFNITILLKDVDNPRQINRPKSEMGNYYRDCLSNFDGRVLGKYRHPAQVEHFPIFHCEPCGPGQAELDYGQQGSPLAVNLGWHRLLNRKTRFECLACALSLLVLKERCPVIPATREALSDQAWSTETPSG